MILTGERSSTSAISVIILSWGTGRVCQGQREFFREAERLNNKELVYSSFDLIEKNLKEDISVFSVSDSFGFSQYYFSRIFKAVTGYSLKDYILGRKISEACLDITRSDRTIIDVAFDYGFGSHESFSRAFHRITGMNPSEYRKQGGTDSIPLLSPLTMEAVEGRVPEPNREPEELELDEIRLIGIPFYFNLALQNDLSKPWGNLVSHVSLIKNRILPEKYYQLQYWFPDQDLELFYFFIAVEVEDFADIPLQFTAKTIPGQRYLKFYHKGRANTVGKTYDYIYNEYLPATDYRLPHCYNFEYYGDECLGPDNEDSVSEIYIPVN